MPLISDKIQIPVQKGSAIIALILNTCLVLLIIRKSPKELGAYKFLMIYISILEVLYAIVDILVLPIFHNTGFTFIILTRLETAFFGPQVQLILSGIYCGLYGSCMAMFGIHFIYRCFVMKGNAKLKSFHSWRILFWFAIPIIYGLVWGSIAVVFCGPRDITDKVIEFDLLDSLDINFKNTVYVAPYLFDEHHEIYWPVVISLLVDCIIINSSFFTVCYFGYQTFRELRKLKYSNVSLKNKTLQVQLYYALVTQTLIPVILLQLPATILFLSVFVSFDVGEFSGLVAMTIAVYPAIDPLPTMFIVTSYRHGILEIFNKITRIIMCRWNRPTRQGTSNTQSIETTRL